MRPITAHAPPRIAVSAGFARSVEPPNAISFTSASVGQVNGNLTIKTTWTRERAIQNVRPVSRAHHHDARTLIKAVHFYQQLIEGLILVGRGRVVTATTLSS